MYSEKEIRNTKTLMDNAVNQILRKKADKYFRADITRTVFIHLRECQRVAERAE